ncbi:MAG: DUF2235 domain-containing protein [Amaricoccus sp.]
MGVEQKAYHHPGVGTNGSRLARIVDGITGNGLSEAVKSAYSWLAHTYRPGDDIFLFGFSRGASSCPTARSPGCWPRRTIRASACARACSAASRARPRGSCTTRARACSSACRPAPARCRALTRRTRSTRPLSAGRPRRTCSTGNTGATVRGRTNAVPTSGSTLPTRGTSPASTSRRAGLPGGRADRLTARACARPREVLTSRRRDMGGGRVGCSIAISGGRG